MSKSKRKQIGALFDSSFEIDDDQGRTWTITPPNKLRGTQIAVLWAGLNHQKRAGGPCKACGSPLLDGLESKTRAMWETLQDREFEETILGAKLYNEMMDAEVSAPSMYWIAQYSMWYWVLGEESADNMADTYAHSKRGTLADGTEPSDEDKVWLDPKDRVTPSPSTSGQSTE